MNGLWTPLGRGEFDHHGQGIKSRIAELQRLARRAGKKAPSKAKARAILEREDACEVWVNDVYMVQVDRSQAPMIHVSIKTHDKAPIRDWRHFQRIKNEVLGPECEAVEIYPAESRLLDTANQYHLWGYDDPEIRIPLGFNLGREVSDVALGRARQRHRSDG